MVQDVMSIKTMLLKLKRVLHEVGLIKLLNNDFRKLNRNAWPALLRSLFI